jgi:NAD(P)-dependent dehydrogenase (short-subunit alcohol dehydrogenase family)/acyl carrier protein
MYPFRRNLTFHYVDLALMSETHPQRIGQLLDTVFCRIADGDLPAAKYTLHQFGEAATAIRVMSAAEHTGKLVLDVPRTGVSTVVVPQESARVFRDDGAYLITGGLGGLGLFLAEKMAGAGCGRIVLTSRSRPDAAAQAVIDRIRANGADIVVECGDVAARETADRLVQTATATGLPVRGVLHAAAVVEDATLNNITDDLIDRDWAPKVYGAWNLHQATVSQPLDWFCSFSSAAALLGSRGQGAYAAANSWLDVFTHWRRAQGLPASAIAWGAWDKIGRGAGLAEAGETTMIAPEDGAHAFQMLLRHDRAFTGYISITGTPWLTALAQRSRFAEALQSASQTATEAGRFRDELNQLPPDEWPNRLRQLVSEQVSLILRRSVDPNRSLAEYGLDSLGNLELRTRIETETGVRISSTNITTVRGLAGHLCNELAELDAVPA